MKYSIIIAAGVLMLVASCKDNTGKDATLDQNIPPALAAAGPECYLKVTGRDSMIFQMDRNGDSVRGVFNWKPYEKDIKMQNFKGKLTNGKGEAIAQVSAEGMNTTEQLDFVVKDNRVVVKFGEMEQGSDGIWRYKTGAPISEQVLPKVNCP